MKQQGFLPSGCRVSGRNWSIALFLVVIVMIVEATGYAGAANDGDTLVKQYRHLGYIVVTPHGPLDGGDFGPFTPGTKTAGIQEAINEARKEHLNLFIAGVQGDRGGGAHYITTNTIYIPPMQGFRIDGGEAVITYNGNKTADTIRIDSCMDCHYRFGILTNAGNGAVIRLAPVNPVPIDGLKVITDSSFSVSSVVGGGFFSFDTHQISGLKGTGILLDASLGPILWNRINANAVLLCNRGVYLHGSGVQDNWIRVLHNHQCRIHLQLGDKDSVPEFNRIDMSINSEGVRGSVGADLFGSRNFLTLDVSQASKGKGLIFEESAKDNIVYELNLAGGTTNRAKIPTNEVITASPVGFQVETPAVPKSDQVVTNRNPYMIEILILDPGKVSSWILTDVSGDSQKIRSGLFPGQTVLLGRGESIRLSYTVAPKWRWRAFSGR